MKNNLKRTRKQPDVRKIKKHSDIVKTYDNRLTVAGDREKTSYGYVVPGFSGKAFSTKYECMLAGTSTDLLMHDKKDKVIRVVSGQGFVILYKQNEKGNWEPTQQRLIPGDEISLERGVQYRITTTSNEDLEMFVVESVAYQNALKIIEKAEVTREVADERLKSPTEFQRLQGTRPDLLDRPRTKSKAVEQLKAERQNRNQSPQIEQPENHNSPESANREGFVNPKPTGGKFNDAGAG